MATTRLAHLLDPARQVGGDSVHVVYPHTRVTANGDLKYFLKKEDLSD